jgi:hypothetical protein
MRSPSSPATASTSRAKWPQRSPPEMFWIGITKIDGGSARDWMRATPPDCDIHHPMRCGVSRVAQKTLTTGKRRRFGSVGAIGFLQDAAQVVGHGVRADAEHLSHLAVVASYGDEPQDIDLPGRESAWIDWWRALGCSFPSRLQLTRHWLPHRLAGAPQAHSHHGAVRRAAAAGWRCAAR